jgi:hypothetical protein
MNPLSLSPSTAFQRVDINSRIFMNTVMPKRTPALTTLTLVAGWLLTVRWLSTWARWRKWGERCMGPSETRLQGQTNMQGVSIDFTNCNLGAGAA